MSPQRHRVRSRSAFCRSLPALRVSSLYWALVLLSLLGLRANAHTAVPFGPELEVDGDGVRIERQETRVGIRIADARHPTLRIRPKSGSWDWSRFEMLEVVMEHSSPHAIDAKLSAQNAGSDGLRDRVVSESALAPGRPTSVRLRLTRRPEVPAPFGRGKYPGTTQPVAAEVGTVMPQAIAEVDVELRGLDVGQEVTITSLRLLGDGVAAPVPFFPFVDTYGQYIHREWPGKVHSDDELRAGADEEVAELNQLPDLPGRDRFGGWSDGPRLRATGSFRTEKREGRWWLVTPDGTLFFSFGPVGVRSTESGILTGRDDWFRDLPDPTTFAAAYVEPHGGLGDYDPTTTRAISFLRANLIRKYGEDWSRRAAEVARLRLRKHGFNTMGNWSEPAYYLGGNFTYTVAVTPRCRMLRTGWQKFPDVFDPGYEAALDDAMRSAAQQTSADPFNLGYFIDNELGWGWLGRALADAALAAPVDQPSKLKLVAKLKEQYATIEKLNHAWESNFASWDALLASREKAPAKPNAARHADLAAFQADVTRRYFQLSRDAVRRHAPDKLYLGCRMADYCGLYPDLCARAAEYCDVVSFNIYKWAPEADEFAERFDKPIIIGEFGYWPSGVTPFNKVGGAGQAPDRGKRLIEYVDRVLSKPNFVGCHLYLYADQVVSGRGDGESQPTGLVTVTDQPKRDLFDAARVVAARIYPPVAKP